MNQQLFTDGHLGSAAVACVYGHATEELHSVFMEFVFRDYLNFNLFLNLLIHLAAICIVFGTKNSYVVYVNCKMC